MARHPRYELPDGLVHVTCRGNRRQPIFRDEIDYAWFFHDLGEAVKRFSWTCLGYAALPNHEHLILEAERGALSRGMQWLNGRHARRFNFRHGYVGHLFQERFASEAIETDGHLLSVLRYVALNTWRAGLVEHPARCARSSHRAVVGLLEPPRFLAVNRVLELFGRDRRTARRRYAEFVEAELRPE